MQCKKVLFDWFNEKSIQNDEQLPTLTFIGNAGGILGSLMGLSFISLVEVFYHGTNSIVAIIFKHFKSMESVDVKRTEIDQQ